MRRVRHNILYAFALIFGIWLLGSSIRDLLTEKLEDIPTETVSKPRLPEATKAPKIDSQNNRPAKKFDSPNLEPKISVSQTQKTAPQLITTVAHVVVRFDNLSALLDVISKHVQMINVVPTKSKNKNAASLSILESDVYMFQTGELYDQLTDNQCKIDPVVATDPRFLHRLKGESVNQNLTSHIIIRCDVKIILVLTVLVPRNDYYWTAQFNSSEYAEFQQPSKAFDGVFIDNLSQSKQDKRLWTPSNNSLWSWHFQYSRFIECDYENVVWPFEHMFSSFVESHNETLSQIELQTVRNLTLKHRVPFQIYGGTLLGWYRQCDFIPLTEDLDIIANETYITYELFKDLWNGGELNILVRYGRPNDSLQLNTVNKAGWRQTHLFTWHYESYVDNETYVNYYFEEKMKVFRLAYPIVTEICTAELLGVLVYVPCEPKRILETEYKKGWFQPQRHYESKSGVLYQRYNKSTWPDVYHYYSNHSCTDPSIMEGCD